MTSTTNGFERSTRALSTSILEAAVQIARRADVHPQRIKERLVSISVILAIGLVGVVATLLAIRAGLPGSEPARLLMLFLLFGSLAVTFASGLAFVLVTWSAYVYEYVQALEAKAAVADATDQIHEIVQAIAELGHDPDFGREVVNLVLAEIQARKAGVRAREVAQLIEDFVEVAATINREPSFGGSLAGLICMHLDRKAAIGHFMEDAENDQHIAGSRS